MLRRIRELFNDVFRQADLVLLALCIGASLFGILMIASATHYMHTSKLMLVQAAALCIGAVLYICLLYTSPSPRDYAAARMPSSA